VFFIQNAGFETDSPQVCQQHHILQWTAWSLQLWRVQ